MAARCLHPNTAKQVPPLAAGATSPWRREPARHGRRRGINCKRIEGSAKRMPMRERAECLLLHDRGWAPPLGVGGLQTIWVTDEKEKVMTMTNYLADEARALTTINLTDEDREALRLLRENEELTYKVDFWQGQQSEPYWTAHHMVALDKDGEFTYAHGETVEKTLRELHTSVEKFSDREWAAELAKGEEMLLALLGPDPEALARG